MAIDQENAASSLSDVAKVQLRTWQALRHWVAGQFLIMWGVLTAVGYVAGYLWPGFGWYVWAVVMTTGVLGGFVILFFYARRAGTRPRDNRILYSMLVFLAYGFLWTQLLAHQSSRQLEVFWPTLFMLGFVVAGFWVGRFFMWCGLLVTILIVGGYLWAGDWLDLWMAVVEGGAMIGGGIYLMRVGVQR